MALEILDVTIDATAFVQARGGFAIFDTIRFRDRNGKERRFKTVCTAGIGTAIIGLTSGAKPYHRRRVRGACGRGQGADDARDPLSRQAGR